MVETVNYVYTCIRVVTELKQVKAAVSAGGTQLR